MWLRILWKTLIASGPAALYNSTGIPSFPGTWLEFIWWMAFMILSTDGWWSSSSRVGCWGICSSVVVLLKCCDHHSLKDSWSFISVDPSADSKGVGPDCEGLWVIFRALKSYFGVVWICVLLHFICLSVPSMVFHLTQSPSGLVLWDVWIGYLGFGARVILPLHIGLVLLM